MPGYNDYSNYGNFGAYRPIPPMPVPGTFKPPQPDNRQNWLWYDYVRGRVGADSYQLPTGVTNALLFDTDEKRYYVKGYDNNGMPRVLEDNDFTNHVDPPPEFAQTPDMSQYATKNDIQEMLEKLTKLTKPNLSGYVTQQDLDHALNSLTIGAEGRIVRSNEPNA